MGWISRYGKWQDDFARPVPGPIRFRHMAVALFLLTIIGGCVACFPLTLTFVPRPEVTEYIPEGIFCGTCEELWQHNRDLFNREGMLCYGPPTHVGHPACEILTAKANKIRNIQPSRKKRPCTGWRRDVGSSKKGMINGCAHFR